MNIYVSNINFKSTDQDLQDLFAPYGEVVCAKVITDKFTGRSRGFGFVEMGSTDSGNAAIEALNGVDFMEKTLSVTEARPRTEKKPFQSGGGNRFGGGGGGRTGGYNDRGGNGGGRDYNKRY
ncbi:MAG: RNA-binding protein [Saprospiraceae bacterium]|nr:RNA-binding protein [Saprospiraceae bacterium]